jgi:hypothetical protein
MKKRGLPHFRSSKLISLVLNSIFRHRAVSEVHRISDAIKSYRRFEPEMYNANLSVQPDLFRIDQRKKKQFWLNKKGFTVSRNHGIPDINLSKMKMSQQSKFHEPYHMASNASMRGKRESRVSLSPTSRNGQSTQMDNTFTNLNQRRVSQPFEDTRSLINQTNSNRFFDTFTKI